MTKILASRYDQNPILKPDSQKLWQAKAVFNASVVKSNQGIHVLYRAESAEQEYENTTLCLSTIGCATSQTGYDLTNHRQLIVPSTSWDKYGCEDPRVTYIDGQYLIFYTGLSQFPPDAHSIKVGVALSDDLTSISEKHLVTPFNAKAMALFPEKINGKYVAVLTVNTDAPPSQIALVEFETLDQIWDHQFWRRWYQHYEEHALPIQRVNSDHIEVGAVPVKTDAGWVLIYSHIRNYQDHTKRIFGIEALLLDLADPTKIVGRTEQPFLQPELHYEQIGATPNVIFPSGAMIQNEDLLIYYGATDMTIAVAQLRLTPFLSYLQQSTYKAIPKLIRYARNPILAPVSNEAWRAQGVFNAAAILENDKVHLLYRAMSWDHTSTIGYAASHDGFHLEDVDHEPIYIPRTDFEKKIKSDSFSGCEDPRITRYEDQLYMFYTAYNGQNPPQVAFTSISIDDFNHKRWFWKRPVLISDPKIDNKNACLFPEKIKDKFVILHRTAGQEIAIDLRDDLEFAKCCWLEKEGAIAPRPGYWDSAKIGIAGPPHKTDQGWLLIYHGVSEEDRHYRLGYILLDLEDPFNILYRSPYPILEPVTTWEKIGIVNDVVFSCGSVIKDDTLFVYYGGADRVLAVATIKLNQLLTVL